MSSVHLVSREKRAYTIRARKCLFKRVAWFACALMLAPLFANALSTVREIIGYSLGLMGSIVPLLIGVGIVVFLVGLLRYIFFTDNAEMRKASRTLMLWGVFSIFTMVSVWGLVRVLTVSFNFDNSIPSFPNFPDVYF